MSRYLDGIAYRGPRSSLCPGFEGSGRHDTRPQSLGCIGAWWCLLPCRELRRLKAGCAHWGCWRLLHLCLWIRQRVHDGWGDGNWGHEVIGDLGKNKQRLCHHCKQRDSSQLPTSLLTTLESPARQRAEPLGFRSNGGRWDFTHSFLCQQLHTKNLHLYAFWSLHLDFCSCFFIQAAHRSQLAAHTDKASERLSSFWQTHLH